MDPLEGKVWLIGDNLDTDAICPGKLLDAPLDEMAQHVLESVKPGFPGEVKPGDVIVAGGNFGCGSSREQAPQVLKEVGIGCIVAESFARIFFRSAIAIGLPVLICPGVSRIFEEGDTAQVDVEKATVRNATSGVEMAGDRLSEQMLEILSFGGILELMKAETGGARGE